MALNVKLNARLQGFESSVEDGFQDLSREAFNRIKTRTPVDTGRARDGWTISGTPTDITILNEVPYIEFLENGHSRQAPNGMVRITLEELFRNRSTSISIRRGKMTHEQIRQLVATTVNNSTLDNEGSVFYENQVATNKTSTWFRVNVTFGEPTPEIFGGFTQVNILYVQIFYSEDTGVRSRNRSVDTLNELLQFKTLSDSNGYLQFRGGSVATIGKQDEDYIQANYSIPFILNANI